VSWQTENILTNFGREFYWEEVERARLICPTSMVIRFQDLVRFSSLTIIYIDSDPLAGSSLWHTQSIFFEFTIMSGNRRPEHAVRGADTRNPFTCNPVLRLLYHCKPGTSGAQYAQEGNHSLPVVSNPNEALTSRVGLADLASGRGLCRRLPGFLRKAQNVWRVCSATTFGA
jgi:hypothetical protein